MKILSNYIFSILIIIISPLVSQAIVEEHFLDSISINPPYIVIPNSNPFQVQVIGNYSDGSHQIINEGITYSSTNRDLFWVNANGQITPFNNGEGVLIVETAGLKNYVGVKILSSSTSTDSDGDGVLDFEDPMPYISTPTSTGLTLGYWTNSYATVSILGTVSFNSSLYGGINNYIITAGAKVSGNLTNTSQTSIEVLAAFLLAPESNHSTGPSFEINHKTFYVITGTQDSELLSNYLLEPGESIGLIATLMNNFDLRGDGLTWLYIANEVPGDSSSQCWIISQPPIVTNFDGDSFLDHKDADDDNDGVSDVEELNSGKDFLNPYDAPLISQFIASATNITEGNQVNFYSYSTGYIQDYSWNFGDGFTNIGKSPSHIYNSEGTFNVSLYISNNSDSSIHKKERYITVMPSDVDHDGIPDKIEDASCTDPFDPDTDGNGVWDGDEDCDGDGFTNKQEVLCHSDPADPNIKCVMSFPWLMLLLD